MNWLNKNHYRAIRYRLPLPAGKLNNNRRKVFCFKILCSTIIALSFSFPFFIPIIIGITVPLHSCSPSSRFTRKAYLKGLESQPYDAIIVPGYPYDGKEWNPVLKLRIGWGVYLYKSGIAKNIIFSGSAVYSPYIESKVMALYASGMGVPPGNIFTEERAEHSTENVYYSYLLAKRSGFKKIALATDPFQSKNLESFISKYEIPVHFLPAVFDTLARQNNPEPHINAGLAIRENFVSITERESLFQRLRGTFGKKIIWHEDDLKKKRFKRRYKKRIAKENVE